MNDLLAKFRLRRHRHAPGQPPLQVRMDITTRCNLRCTICALRGRPDHPHTDMAPAVMRRVVEQVFPHAGWVGLACQYEALMSPHITEILDIVGAGPCRNVGIVTNGQLLGEARIRQIVANPAIAVVSVSVDGATPGTYESIRVNGRHATLIRNLEAFARIRAEAGTRRPELRLNTVLVKPVARELPGIVELCARLGGARVEAVRYVPVNPGAAEEIGDWGEVMPALAEAARIARQSGVELYLPVRDASLGPPADDPPKPAARPQCAFSPWCEAPWSSVQIMPNGDLHPCLYWPEPAGNIEREDFQDIWNKPMYLKLRNSLAGGRMHARCAQCNPHGYDNSENRTRDDITRIGG